MEDGDEVDINGESMECLWCLNLLEYILLDGWGNASASHNYNKHLNSWAGIRNSVYKRGKQRSSRSGPMCK